MENALLLRKKAQKFVDIAEILKNKGYNKASTRLASFPLIRIMSLFDAGAKDLVSYLDKYIDSNNNQTRKMLDWTPIPLEQTILDMALSIAGTLVKTEE